jgi:protein-S-isoprenylcysteine O-methyltransferase Ste14
MNANAVTEQHFEKSDLRRLILQSTMKIAIGIAFLAALLFITSGRLEWIMAWVFIGVNVVTVVINMIVLVPKYPDLIIERSRIPKGTKLWDKVLMAFAGLATLAILILTALNARFEWAPRVSLSVQIIALIFVMLGYAMFSWAMLSNRFFSKAVRIQRDRGQTVVTDGPYRYIRHPGYVGALLYTTAMPVMLGSLWALIPCVVTVLFLFLRTLLEDRMLQNELEGYTDYAQRVRYRLVPGVW